MFAPTPIPFFDQWKEFPAQSFNLTGLDGSPVPFTLEDVDAFLHNFAVQGATYGCSMGCCTMLLIALMVLAIDNPIKARRPIFLLNTVNLFLFTLRAFVGIIVISAPIEGFGQKFLQATEQYGNATAAPNIIAYVLTPFLYASILVTLVLQVRTVFGGTKMVQNVSTIILSVAALALIAIEITECAVYIKHTFTGAPIPGWLDVTIKTFFVTFVGTCSLAFVYKLGVAIQYRRKVGITKFGPLHILFIMSCPCLVVHRNSPCPSPLTVIVVFYVLALTVIPVQNIVAIGQAFIVCSLPLSTMWASTETSARSHMSSISAVTVTAHPRANSVVKVFLHDKESIKSMST
jgi:hypothetical protein